MYVEKLTAEITVDTKCIHNYQLQHFLFKKNQSIHLKLEEVKIVTLSPVTKGEKINKFISGFPAF